MRNRFEILALCEMDWKADQVATDNYSSWYNHWITKGGVKKEQHDPTIPAATGATTGSLSKRPHDLPDDQASKKFKPFAEPGVDVEMRPEQAPTSTMTDFAPQVPFKVRRLTTLNDHLLTDVRL
jgi:hypothetical protein